MCNVFNADRDRQDAHHARQAADARCAGGLPCRHLGAHPALPDAEARRPSVSEGGPHLLKPLYMPNGMTEPAAFLGAHPAVPGAEVRRPVVGEGGMPEEAYLAPNSCLGCHIRGAVVCLPSVGRSDAANRCCSALWVPRALIA